MNTTKELLIVREATRDLTRREAARLLLTCMASGTFVWTSASHPVWKHLANEDLMGATESAVAEAKLHFMNATHFESLRCLAEAIVPGASKAKSAEFIDLLLSVEAPKHQKEFGDSLLAFETESTKRYGKKVSAIAAHDLNQLLTDASSGSKTERNTQPLGDAFENLKEWVSGAYYSSEIGMRELGWTPDRVFPEFSGCTHSEHNG